MIRRNRQMRTERCEHLKGGDGCVELIHILNEDEMYGMGRFFGITRLPPGASNGLHTHHGDFETYYILSGTAQVCDNGTDVVVNPGDMVQCLSGQCHSIRNIGQDMLEYIAVILFTEKKTNPKDETGGSSN